MDLDLVMILVPIRSPFPNVSCHLVEPIAVRWKAAYRPNAFKTVLVQILPGKLTLPCVGHVCTTRREIIAPYELSSRQSSSRGKLPLGFHRQLFADPFGIGFHVFIGDLHYGMFCFPFQRARRSLGVAPVGPGNIRPPLIAVAQVDALFGFLKSDGSGHKQLRLRSWIIVWIRHALGGCHMLGRFDKSAELLVGHGVRVHPKSVDGDLVAGASFG